MQNSPVFINGLYQKAASLSLMFLLVLGGMLPALAQDYLPEKPKLETSVYDLANMMEPSQAKALEQKLIRYSDTTSTQMVVITIASLEGNDVAIYATELAHKWGIGQQDKDNGVLILVARDDRKVTIRTGYGVEHLLTDALSKRIIQNIITPAFKQGDFYGGLDAATGAIIEILRGEYQGEPRFEEPQGKIPALFIVLAFIVIILILSRINRNRGGGNRGTRSRDFSIWDAIILSSSGRGGFGGGGFGGGGASGGW